MNLIPWRSSPPPAPPRQEPKIPTERRNYLSSQVSLYIKAANTFGASSAATSAIEVAAAIISKSISMAQVDAEPWIRELLCCEVLAQMGRDLIVRGETCYIIEGAGERITPAGTWHWDRGHGVDRSTWSALVTQHGPGGNSPTRRITWDRMLFTTYSTDTTLPWIGNPPWKNASLASTLMANIEQSLSYEAGTPVANIVPMPEGVEPDDEDDDELEVADPYAGMKKSFAEAKGGLLFPETVAGGSGLEDGTAPAHDFGVERLGMNPPPAQVTLYSAVYNNILSVCGVSPDMFGASGTAQGQREAWRRFHATTVLPLARRIEAEARRKLGPVELQFDPMPLDLQGRASALKNLVDAGMDLDKALEDVWWRV